MSALSVAERINAERGALSPAERRVAQVVLAQPELVAFGTVARLATEAETSGASVVRLATRLGYDGFLGLQAAVQADLARRLRPASERIRQPATTDIVGRTLRAELDNVHATLDSLDQAQFARAVALLAARRRRVVVLSGDASLGVATLFATELSQLRAGVELLSGSEVAVARGLAHVEPGDVVVAIDVRRYDRWLLTTVHRAVERGAELVALSDSALSPLAAGASGAFVVSAAGAGPFDSHVGTLALLNALVTGVAVRLKVSATDRLDRVEAAWREADALTDP